MASKFVLVLYVTAFLVQAISAQFFGPGQFGPSIPYGPGYREPIGPYGPGCRDLGPFNPGCGVNVGSTGGSFPVTSVSPIAPTGLTVVSENTIEGRLGVGGQLPFLGTVALEGAFPTAGVGAISYGCGTGVGITSEGPISTGILGGSLGPVAVGPYGPGPFGCGY